MPKLHLKFKIMFFWIVWLTFFSSFSTAEQPKNPFCPCEKIKQEKRCENPDCIKICNLQSLFAETHQKITDQCLKENPQNKSWTKKKVLATKLQSFLKEVKNKVQKIETASQATLEEICPHCYLFPELSAQFKPKPQEESCHTHIQSPKYKKWKKLREEDEEFCDSLDLTDEQETLCQVDDKFSACCDSQYLKTHELPLSKSINLKETETCSKKQQQNIHKYFQEYVSALVSGNDKIPASQKLWSKCPNPCSFSVNYTIQMDTDKCSGDLSLKVDCTHRVEKSFFIPVYDVSVKYKGGIQCQEK